VEVTWIEGFLVMGVAVTTEGFDVGLDGGMRSRSFFSFPASASLLASASAANGFSAVGDVASKMAAASLSSSVGSFFTKPTSFSVEVDVLEPESVTTLNQQTSNNNIQQTLPTFAMTITLHFQNL
jgi:hypothetical protein